MEALIFFVDAIAIVVLIFTSLRNDRRTANEPQFGPFQFIETLAKPKPLPKR